MSLSVKLLKSLHNQLYARQQVNVSSSAEEDIKKELVLRKINLIPGLLEVLSYCRPHLGYIVLLDFSFSVVDSGGVATICAHFYQLQYLYAKSCGLSGSLDNVKWPDTLQELDLSRNRLNNCPQGVFKLMHLQFINLSGNSISFIPTGLLELPNLKKCHFLNNPLSNVPKEICREGVVKLRDFFSVEAIPVPRHSSGENIKSFRLPPRRRSVRSNSEYYSDLRRQLLCCQPSFESDYGSCQTSHSSGSVSCIDVDFSDCSDSESVDSCGNPQLPIMMYLPAGYKKSQGDKLCQVYLPQSCMEKIEVTVVKDLSLHPALRKNELLISPVVRITPHGLKFGVEPAMIILPHCTKRNASNLAHFVPLCSNTSISEAPDWVELDSCTKCIIDEEHVLFSTFHFSLFAVALLLTYPSSSMMLQPHVGGTLLLPELPGFQLRVPNTSVAHLTEEVIIKSTAHFCDKSYNASETRAPASACIKLEPHGLHFSCPVEVTLPLPDYITICQHFPHVNLELWSSQPAPNIDNPSRWKLINDTDFVLEDFDNNSKLARIKINHFSFFEFLYNICSSSLHTLGLGASYIYNQLPNRARHVFVRYQAFISHPHDLTFGLLVAIFKFGDPLTGLSNYPLLVADSGTKRVALLIGDLRVQITGHFTANHDVSESLERKGRLVDFTGEDFCERFEFALQLLPNVSLPLQAGQLLGQLHLTQQHRSIACNLMIPPLSTSTPIAPVISIRNFPVFDEFTPPRSPEPQGSSSRESSLCDMYQSRKECSQTLGKRKRSLSRDDSIHSHSPSPSTSRAKRRILISDNELTDRELLNISLKCGSKYLELGLHLGLDYQTIANRVSRHEGKGEHLKAFEVLQEWKGRGFSFSELAQALDKVGLNQMALRYCYNEVPG